MPDTAQFILHRLTEWGIERAYGYPGDGINGAIHLLNGAKKLAMALPVDPHRRRIVKESIQGKVEEFVTR
jgi:hypothetical protein